jgi:hypothetical protein
MAKNINDLVSVIVKAVEAPIEASSVRTRNFLENTYKDKDDNFFWEKDENNIRHKFVILSSSNDMSLKFGFSFSSLTDITEPQVGHLELDLENGELEVSLDDNTSEDELNYDDFTVTEFIKQAMTILFEAIEVLDENDE